MYLTNTFTTDMMLIHFIFVVIEKNIMGLGEQVTDLWHGLKDTQMRWPCVKTLEWFLNPVLVVELWHENHSTDTFLCVFKQSTERPLHKNHKRCANIFRCSRI